MKMPYKLPNSWKTFCFTYWIKFKIQWYTFWRNWHHVKYFYYNSSRHLLKTRKYNRKLRSVKKIMVQ
ncbi:hypothetical protein BKP35_10955 [Anaerobacillus arseniciselenatis]|uniref:Uncharacterized protein n=1 Tax=Anaerobacillus arseniciselenatis TaxID=85682 RepID=A0A1S2LJ20_9BACI|nr:hypothetical protein BKP35_10955 [Anaerobacillus arseniciselenatis]